MIAWTSVQSETTNETLLEALQNCQHIESDYGRLVCYDNLSKAQQESATAQSSQAAINEDVSTKQTAAIENNRTVTKQLPVLVADLDEAGFKYSVGRMDLLGHEFDAMLVSLGHRVNVADFSLSNQPDIFFNVFAQIRSQFDVEELSTRNNRGGALINTDFTVGGELVQIRPDWQWRLSYRHRSTHLGDEFLIENQEYLDKRLNLSYETLKFLAFKSLGQWDIYGGGGFITRMEPSGLHQFQWQAGGQYKVSGFPDFTPVLGMDLAAWAEADRNLNVTLRAGIEINKWFNRPVNIFLEYQEGHSPYGQFFTEDFNYFGLSVYNHW
ncbi:DUF1207 domain-containing protein [Marinicella gelatinilytica]|uniref:DUF1207 domain-containing protein n=1 Tax=Marinicella gelatinilytica TaxID=2996017 RepID=UPI002260A98D|nr:DUF1207 domain-containing protein [Marinicella gelatinilytica]MCX7543941.1 DUF1207 domain-containing protein [Marinicella gelatinilytica]